METDFPAAHSMDTVWFAVDRYGYVAQFDSSLCGAVPDNAAPQFGDEILEKIPRRTVSIVDLACATHPAQPEEERHVPADQVPNAVITVLRSSAGVEEALAGGKARVLPSSDGIAILWKSLKRRTYKRLHTTGQCMHCRKYYGYFSAGSKAEIENSAYYFIYRHPLYEILAGPYGRESRPGNPVKLEDLPAWAQAEILKCRFLDLSFQESPYIQPAEHTSCEAWTASWVSCDGRAVHAFPGKEAEYVREHAHLAKYLTEVQGRTVDAPLSSESSAATEHASPDGSV